MSATQETVYVDRTLLTVHVIIHEPCYQVMTNSVLYPPVLCVDINIVHIQNCGRGGLKLSQLCRTSVTLLYETIFSSCKHLKKTRINSTVSVPADIYFLPWKSSVHKFISTIWQAVNGQNVAGMSFPSFWVSKTGWFLVYGMETVNDKSTQHIAQDGWKIKLIYLKMLSYIYIYIYIYVKNESRTDHLKRK